MHLYVLLLMRPWVSKLAIRQLPATSGPRVFCVCSNVFTGGLVCASTPAVSSPLCYVSSTEPSRLTVCWPIILMPLYPR